MYRTSANTLARSTRFHEDRRSQAKVLSDSLVSRKAHPVRATSPRVRPKFDRQQGMDEFVAVCRLPALRESQSNRPVAA
jgi:hypothetical protein